MSLERKKRRRKRRSVSETSLNESGSSGSSGQSNSGEKTSDTNIYFQLKYVTVRQQGRPGQPEIINHEPGDFAPRARQ